MLAPKKVKWRKMQKGRRKGMAWRGATLAFGDYGLQAIERGWLTAREIEAARVALTRYIKRGGRVWVRIFPDKPLTKKPAETRMGKGKGSPEIWVAVVKPGRMLFEMEGVDSANAKEALRLAAAKLSPPSRASAITREPPHEAAGSTGHERRRAAHARARARRRCLSPAAQAGDLPAPQPDEGAPDQARPGARQDRAPPADETMSVMREEGGRARERSGWPT